MHGPFPLLPFCTVCSVCSNTPEIKRAAIRSYGVEPIVCEATIDAREQTCAAIQRETGATFVPPYNHPKVIAGQGTIALEFLEQVGKWLRDLCCAVTDPSSAVSRHCARPSWSEMQPWVRAECWLHLATFQFPGRRCPSWMPSLCLSAVAA